MVAGGEDAQAPELRCGRMSNRPTLLRDALDELLGNSMAQLRRIDRARAAIVRLTGRARRPANPTVRTLGTGSTTTPCSTTCFSASSSAALMRAQLGRSSSTPSALYAVLDADDQEVHTPDARVGLHHGRRATRSGPRTAGCHQYALTHSGVLTEIEAALVQRRLVQCECRMASPPRERPGRSGAADARAWCSPRRAVLQAGRRLA